MNAIEALRNEQKIITGLFRQAESVMVHTPEMKPGVIRELLMELEVLGQVEREIFYPELRASADLNTQSLIDDSLAARKEFDRQIQIIRKSDVQGEDFNVAFRSFIVDIEGHFESEESRLFPQATALLNDKLEELGTRIEARRNELMGELCNAEALPWKVQNLHGGEQRRRM